MEKYFLILLLLSGCVNTQVVSRTSPAAAPTFVESKSESQASESALPPPVTQGSDTEALKSTASEALKPILIPSEADPTQASKPRFFADVAQLEIIPKPISISSKGQNLLLEIQFLNQNQEIIHLEKPPLIFHSSNPEIIKVYESGKILALNKEGSSLITVSLEGTDLKVSQTVEIVPPRKKSGGGGGGGGSSTSQTEVEKVGGVIQFQF